MRLIDADALEVDLKRQYDEVFGKARKTVNPDDFFIERYSAYHANVVGAEQNGFFEYLKTRPTVDAVPVVRCENCKHYALWNNGWAMHHCDRHDRTAYDQDFCSYGERWDDNGE